MRPLSTNQIAGKKGKFPKKKTSLKKKNSLCVKVRFPLVRLKITQKARFSDKKIPVFTIYIYYLHLLFTFTIYYEIQHIF